MGEFDLEAILKVAADEKVGANAQSLTGFFKEADNFLNSFDNIIDHLDKAYVFVHKMERSPIMGTIFRQYYGSDKIGPLVKEEPGIVPKTVAHEQILLNINKLDENQLKDLVQRLVEVDKQKKLEEEKKDEKNPD